MWSKLVGSICLILEKENECEHEHKHEHEHEHEQPRNWEKINKDDSMMLLMSFNVKA